MNPDNYMRPEHYNSKESLSNNYYAKHTKKLYDCPICKEQFLITLKKSWTYKVNMKVNGRQEQILTCSYDCYKELKSQQQRGVAKVESQVIAYKKRQAELEKKVSK